MFLWNVSRPQARNIWSRPPVDAYEITPEGKFVVVVPAPNAQGEQQTNRSPQQINVVLNWFTELQQRVPVK
jgi:hypothetical protein